MLVEQTVTGDEKVLVEKEHVAAPLPRGGAVSLTRKRPARREVKGAVVLLHGFACTRYNWHLSGRSFSAYLASRGWDVWNLELRGHGRSRSLGSRIAASFEEHVTEDLPAAAEAIRRAGHERFFLVGHSMGGALAYAAAPGLGRRARGVVTISGVFGWGGGGRFIRFSTPFLHAAWKVHRALKLQSGPPMRADVVGKVVALNLRAIEAGLVPMPAEGWAPRSIERALLDEWLHRALDRTSGAILTTMGRWAESGRFSDPDGTIDYAARWGGCDVPSLILAGDRDRLADWARDVRPAYDAARGERTWRLFGRENDGVEFGHVDLIVGREAPRRVWPVIADWLERH